MYFGDLISTVYSMLPVGLIGLLAAAVIYTVFALVTRKKFPAAARTHVVRFLFIAYLAAVAYLTLSPSGAYIEQGGVNLIPFSSVEFAVLSGSEVARQLIVLNIVMFLPMGVFLPWVFPRRINRLYKAAILCALITLLIECLQMILPGGRAFDIDDILMNTFGGCVGYALFALVMWLRKKRIYRVAEKIALLAVLAALPAVCAGVAIFDGGPKEFEYGLSYALKVADEMEFTGTGDYPKIAMTYARNIVPPEETLASMMNVFDVNGTPETDRNVLFVRQGDAYLSVNSDDDARSAMLRQPNNQPPRGTDAELIAEAEAFLQEHGMWQEGLRLEAVWESLIEENGVERPSEKTVSFIMDANDPRFAGSVQASFDSEGIYDAWRDIMQYAPYREAELMPPREAFAEAIKTQKYQAEYDFFTQEGEPRFEPKLASFDHAELIYMQGATRRQNLPAWKFSGMYYDGERQREGTLIAAAIK